MNFMGMGILELSVIFLVTFLVMGPSKSIEMARTTGKVLRDIRRVFNDMASSIDLSGTTSPPADAPPPTTTAAKNPPGSQPQQPPTPGEQHEST